ncbi:molybdopterin-dependent oxidoreductase [Nocardioides bruguierae]|uniref:molybdopterin-dependent oxidoreductase n=1 Tax=Nocardioides bruguierae TaxID=2945102 RepID=UPI0020212192|nr:molybdopterin-dependent oxidoreductase [Nocardioides bruguierae]MCL8024754.1 molybdopterin-dependent oxidoreductase [Nocardioides bruguierae]
MSHAMPPAAATPTRRPRVRLHARPRVHALRGGLNALLLAGLLVGLTACGSETATTAAPEEDGATGATLVAGDEVPAPTGKVLLTVTGGTVTNVDGELQLDRALLDALGTVSYEVDDVQATGEVVTFSGPLVRDVLAVAGVPEDATTMHTVAINDYKVDVPVSDAAELPLMLATTMDGEPMSVARYGPTRFVYPTDGYDLDPATYNPRWIWQLASIDVE